MSGICFPFMVRIGCILFALTAPVIGCAPPAPVVAGAVAVASSAAIPVVHRTALDVVVSVASGRDCSVVNLDIGEPHSRPPEQPPEPSAFCTRSLGVPGCWRDPEKSPGHPREIADGPRALTLEQEQQRTHWWPRLQ
jgi:hypothetical protein